MSTSAFAQVGEWSPEIHMNKRQDLFILLFIEYDLFCLRHAGCSFDTVKQRDPIGVVRMLWDDNWIDIMHQLHLPEQADGQE